MTTPAVAPSFSGVSEILDLLARHSDKVVDTLEATETDGIKTQENLQEKFQEAEEELKAHHEQLKESKSHAALVRPPPTHTCPQPLPA